MSVHRFVPRQDPERSLFVQEWRAEMARRRQAKRQDRFLYSAIAFLVVALVAAILLGAP